MYSNTPNLSTMKLSVDWVLLAAICSAFAAVPISSVGRGTKTFSSIVPNKFIVELKESAGLNAFSKRVPHTKARKDLTQYYNANDTLFSHMTQSTMR